MGLKGNADAMTEKILQSVFIRDLGELIERSRLSAVAGGKAKDKQTVIIGEVRLNKS